MMQRTPHLFSSVLTSGNALRVSRVGVAILVGLTGLAGCLTELDTETSVAALVDCTTAKEWEAGSTYNAGDTVAFRGQFFTARQFNSMPDGWFPDNVPVLWAVAECDNGEPEPTPPPGRPEPTPPDHQQPLADGHRQDVYHRGDGRR